MRLFTDKETMAEVLAGHKKWRRTLEAIEAAPRLSSGVTYSIVDSLTYRRDTTENLATRELVGRRRYHAVIAALSGDAVVEIATQRDLHEAGPYSDLTDRQPFTGAAQPVTVPPGGLLIVDIDEAFRVLPTPDAEAVLLHVTVEGATFHNK